MVNRMHCQMHREMNDRRGFTLVEMLVVIAIIGLLLGLMMPVLASARNMARKTDCQIRLKQIGLAMNSYVDASGNFPDVGQMPSLAPTYPTMVSVLGPYTEQNKQLFACPMDTEYFSKEGLSYEYRSLDLAGKTRVQSLIIQLPGNKKRSRPSTEVMLMYDFGPFHGAATQNGARNVVYLDGHVEPL